jgi:hypothetical protein
MALMRASCRPGSPRGSLPTLRLWRQLRRRALLFVALTQYRWRVGWLRLKSMTASGAKPKNTRRVWESEPPCSTSEPFSFLDSDIPNPDLHAENKLDSTFCHEPPALPPPNTFVLFKGCITKLRAKRGRLPSGPAAVPPAVRKGSAFPWVPAKFIPAAMPPALPPGTAFHCTLVHVTRPRLLDSPAPR